MKLYQITLTFKGYVMAESEEDAIEADYSELIYDNPQSTDLDEVRSLAEVPKGCHEYFPYGNNDDDLTIAEFFDKGSDSASRPEHSESTSKAESTK